MGVHSSVLVIELTVDCRVSAVEVSSWLLGVHCWLVGVTITHLFPLSVLSSDYMYVCAEHAFSRIFAKKHHT